MVKGTGEHGMCSALRCACFSSRSVGKPVGLLDTHTRVTQRITYTSTRSAPTQAAPP